MDQMEVIIGGHRVSGWSEDTDALMMPEAFELLTVRRGADGRLIGSNTNDRGGPVTLKLLANSPSTAFFMSAAAKLLSEPETIICWYGSVRNTAQGYSFTLENGVLTQFPLGQNAGKGTIANQLFTFEFERIIPDYATASFIADADTDIISTIDAATAGIELGRPSDG